MEWSLLHQLGIANTFFQKPFEKIWTHSKTGNQWQIDYILIPIKIRSQLVDADAVDSVDIGSDHRAVKASFIFSGLMKKNGKKKMINYSWRMVDHKRCLFFHLNNNNYDCSELCIVNCSQRGCFKTHA